MYRQPPSGQSRVYLHTRNPFCTRKCLGSQRKPQHPAKSPWRSCSTKQPIMRTEDRLFDRGWVRSAMATRKCGNIYFPKYFMAVRPFFTRIFFKNYLGWRGPKISLKISSGAQSENLEPSLTIQEFFSKKYSWFYMQRMCTLFG